ncbi:Uncharacterized protein LCER1_G000762 [Lachnellula cervina]|uniref:Amidohydrolase-related domain-containing protein n=1 Tax=Lachnellula cervina TaxID=1316786 RepID=A0A7D8V1Q4_9HELO|nr:Uncharacterized protein LCER1_G000762 [Lachnellula cervina]
MTASVITADLLIPGRGQPFKDGAIVYDDRRITWVGGKSGIPKAYKALSSTHVPVLMPGLWDCHVHFLGSQSYITEVLYRESKVLAGARAARDVAEVLNAGFTSVREVGGYGIHLVKAIEEGYLVGPTIYGAGSVLSQTGGHGDGHAVPLAEYQDACANGLFFELCDGVDGCIRAVRMQLRQGAKVIKICASGGVSSEIDHPKHQQFSDAELKAMVEEAHRSERIVAAHCHGKAGIMAALRAGCSTIEHGTSLDVEAIELMLKQGAILVPTRTIQQSGLKMKDSWTESGYKKLQNVAKEHKEAYKLAVKSGVKIALGTDIGFSVGGTPLSHGSNGSELVYAVEAGLSPLQAIEAATANAPETLGLQAPLSGQLKEGYDADFIALSENPLQDIQIMADAKMVTHVWKGGKLFKAPTRDIFLASHPALTF